MRRDSKTDRNQTEIVDFFKKMGVSVVVTSSVGHGFTDLVLGYSGLTVLCEVKDGEKPPSKRRLTPAQKQFFYGYEGSGGFKGAKTVVENLEQAHALVIKMRVVSQSVPNDWRMGAVADADEIVSRFKSER